MPPFRSHKLGVAVDMAGCPNRCRHCWLGHSPSRRLSEATLRRVVAQFRGWVRPGEDEPFARPLTVQTWYREPDYAPNYRKLWALEQALSDEGAAVRFELLSIWRLARDERPLATHPGTLAFMVTPGLDVFSNIGEPMPWWALGNLERDGIDAVMQRFERDEVPGLWAHFHLPVSELARAYGRPDGRRLYSREDLALRWLRQWGEERHAPAGDTRPSGSA